MAVDAALVASRGHRPGGADTPRVRFLAGGLPAQSRSAGRWWSGFAGAGYRSFFRLRFHRRGLLRRGCSAASNGQVDREVRDRAGPACVPDATGRVRAAGALVAPGCWRRSHWRTRDRPGHRPGHVPPSPRQQVDIGQSNAGPAQCSRQDSLRSANWRWHSPAWGIERALEQMLFVGAPLRGPTPWAVRAPGFEVAVALVRAQMLHHKLLPVVEIEPVGVALAQELVLRHTRGRHGVAVAIHIGHGTGGLP